MCIRSFSRETIRTLLVGLFVRDGVLSSIVELNDLVEKSAVISLVLQWVKNKEFMKDPKTDLVPMMSIGCQMNPAEGVCLCC